MVRGMWGRFRPVPPEITEFLIIQETGWTLDEIRSLSEKDFTIMSTLISAYNAAKNKVNEDAAKKR